MEEEIINGFKWVSILGNKMLVIESGRLQECLNYASSECVKAIYISNYNGYYLTDLEFLHQHNWFTEVMSSGDSRNISAIHALKNLRKLNINNEKQEIDLTRFSSLEDCSVDWNNKIKESSLSPSYLSVRVPEKRLHSSSLAITNLFWFEIFDWSSCFSFKLEDKVPMC